MNKLKLKSDCSPLYKISLVLSVCVSLCVTVCCLISFFAPLPSENIRNITSSSEYHTDDNLSAEKVDAFFKNIVVSPNETVYVDNTFENNIENSYLMIKTSFQRFRVFENDTEIYSYGFDLDDDMLGVKIHQIPVSSSEQYVDVRFEFVSPNSLYAGEMSDIHLGDSVSLQKLIFRQSMPFLFFFSITVFTGFLFIVASALFKTDNETKIPILCLGLFSVLWGFFCLFRSEIACWFFSPKVIYSLYITFDILYYIPLMLYVFFMIRHCKKIILCLVAVDSAVTAITIFLHFSNIYTYNKSLPAYNLFFTIIMLPLFICIAIELVKGTPIIRFISPGILIALIFGIGTGIDSFASSSQNSFPLFITSFFIIIIFVWLYSIKNFVEKRNKELTEKQNLEIIQDLSVKKHDQFKLHYEDIKRIRHELNHHFHVIQVLNEQGEKGTINDYLETHINNAKNREQLIYSNNLLVNSIFSHYIERAAADDVVFEYDISMSDTLPISDIDFGSLWMNMIDNAFESCLNIEAKSKRWIKLSLTEKGNMLIVCCENARCQDIKTNQSRVLTTKHDSENHGYGILIMEEICKKYNTNLIISYDEESFKVKTVLFYAKETQ